MDWVGRIGKQQKQRQEQHLKRLIGGRGPTKTCFLYKKERQNQTESGKITRHTFPNFPIYTKAADKQKYLEKRESGRLKKNARQKKTGKEEGIKNGGGRLSPLPPCNNL